MAHRVADRIRETTTSTSSPYTLAGAVTGFRSMASVLTANGDTAFWVVTNGIDWEIFVGTRTSATVLTRTTMLASSNSNSPVSWPAGTKDVFSDIPAAYAVTSAPSTLQASGAGAVKAVGEMTWFPKDPGSAQMARGGSAVGTEPYVECDGGVYNMSAFPALGAFLGSTFGGNGTTTFGMPNLKSAGRYVRSRITNDEGQTQANQNQIHAHTGNVTIAGNVFGEGITDSENTNHVHTFGASGNTGGQSQSHQHFIAGGTGAVQYNTNYAVAPGGVAAPGPVQTNITDFATQDHTHSFAFSGTTSGVNTFHQHHFSFATNNVSLGGALAINASGGSEVRVETFIAICSLKT